ncbi:hypothetical protein L2E82_30081 [Cichorium intybus]|uniref:Uncharacterized protein n=1 Tax=Cichorium intybus TaxID=13427 RepID=A0ACB9CZQ6_CICIN|nr:hypothetical protein L2E82_30081 [Cichorium intybus]
MKIILTFFIPPLSLNNSDIKTYFGSTIHEPSPRAPLQEKEDALKHSDCERFDDGVCIDRGRCDSSEFLDGGVQDAFGGASMEGILAASGSATFKLLGNRLFDSSFWWFIDGNENGRIKRRIAVMGDLNGLLVGYKERDRRHPGNFVFFVGLVDENMDG